MATTGADVCEYHHPLAGLEGCPLPKRAAVSSQFQQLFVLLASLLSHAVDTPLPVEEGAWAGPACLLPRPLFLTLPPSLSCALP
jgi:hypothetical protein